MKKSLTALALALALVGTLAACSTDKNPGSGTAGGNGGTTGGNSGTAGAPAGSAAGSGTASAGQVTRRYGNQSVYNGRTYSGRDYFEDGRYAAGSDGQVYGGYSSSVTRDLTRGARDIVRGTEDVIEDVGRGVGDAVQDITGSGNYSGTPSWEPDSSAVRY